MSFLAPLPLAFMFRDRRGTDEAKFEERERGTESQFISERGEMESYIPLFYINISFPAVLTSRETEKAKMFGLSLCLSTPVSRGFNS